MALKVKAVERLLKFTKEENGPGVYRYVIYLIYRRCRSSFYFYHSS